MAIEFAGFVYDSAGTAISSGVTINLYDRNTVTPVRATTSTNASGYWTISHATEGRFDVEIAYGTTTRRIKYDSAVQFQEIETANLLVRNPGNTFAYDIVPGAITAARTLNLPVITGTDTLAVLGLAQTFTAVQSYGAGGLLRWSAGTAITAAQYEITRDADATNQLHYNVPTGATYEWSVNDVAEMTLSATAVNFQNNSITTTGGGSLTGTWSDLGTVTTVDINGGTWIGTIDGASIATATLTFNDSVTVRFGTAAGESTLGSDGTNTIFTRTSGVLRFTDGVYWIGSTGRASDSTFANANMTVGLTINQGAADDQALALKSPDVAHGMTDNTETDTFFNILKETGASGGAYLRGYTGGTLGILLAGFGVTDNTTHSAVGRAYVEARAYKKSGTTTANPGANANIFAVSLNDESLRFIVDVEGDLFADGSDVTVYDEYDDALVLRAFDLNRGQRGVVNSEWDSFVRHNERDLVEIGILGAPLSEGGLINYTLLSRFQTGAIWQGRKRQYEQQRDIAALKAEIAELRRMLPAA